MKTDSISGIKKELNTLPTERVVELCLRLAKFKKENKELLNYLLYYNIDEEEFIKEVKEEIDIQFQEINFNTLFYIKKSVRKILRMVTKYIRYSGNKQTEIELLIYFVKGIQALPSFARNNVSISLICVRQKEKMKKIIPLLHEDLQFDFKNELKTL